MCYSELLPWRNTLLKTIMENSESWDDILHLPRDFLFNESPMYFHVSDQEIMSSPHFSRVTDIDQPLPDSTGFYNFEDWGNSNAASQHRSHDYANDGATLSYMDRADYPYAQCIELVAIESVELSVFLIARHVLISFKDSLLKRKFTNEDLEEEKEVKSSQGMRENGNRFYCDRPGCNGSFARKADLIRHHRTLHDRFPMFCGCCDNQDRTFSSPRMDKLREHQRKVHKYSGPLDHCPILSCLEKSSFVPHMVWSCPGESLKDHLSHKHNTITPGTHQSNLHSNNCERPFNNDHCGDRLINCSTTSPATSLSSGELKHRRNASWLISDTQKAAWSSSLSDSDMHHSDCTASAKRVRFEDAVSGSERNVSVDIPLHSACKEIGDPSSVVASPAHDPERVRGIQVTEMGVGPSQQDSFVGISEDAHIGPQLADTKQKVQSTTPRISPSQGSSVYTSLLHDTTISITEVSIPNVGPAEYFTLSRLGGKVPVLPYYY